MAAIGQGAGRRRRPSRATLPLAIALALGIVAGAAGTAAWATLRPGAPAKVLSCTGPRTPLVVASSADKSALMTRFAEQFSAGAGQEASPCVQVTVETKASGAATTALSSGWKPSDGATPDVWSPTGSIWLPLLEDRLAQAKHPSLINGLAPVPHIATSPMVVAMPRPMATALGWPDKPIGWADLLTLASSRTGWGAFGHPEWGRFQLGKTNPNFSHAGLEGTIAAYYAAVGRTSGLTPGEISSAATRRFVAGVEQSIVRYGDTTASFLSDWLHADDNNQALSYISALVTEENLVPAYNQGNPTADPALAGKHAPPKVPLVAIYPKEGTFIADHPFVVLDAPWVTPAKRVAAQAFLAYLQSPPIQAQWQANFFRDASDRLGTNATQALGVSPGEPHTVLKPPSPAITKQILDSWAQLRKTANVISLIDVSGSMAVRLPGSSQTRLDAAKDAAVASMKLFTGNDEVGLWSFSGGVRGQRDYRELVNIGPMDATVHHSVRRDAITEALKALRPSGNTGLYNSIAAAYRTVLDRYQNNRINAVVVLTDGKNDAQGGLSLTGLTERIRKTPGGRPIRIITIAYGPQADAETLASIARATKGASYLAATPADIPKIYSAALSNL